MQPDVVARAIGIAALAIAAINVAVTVVLWRWSGPWIKVRLKRVQHPQDRLVIEVSNIGRMAVLIKEIGLEDRVPTGGPGSDTTTYITMPLSPTDGKPFPRVLEHTDLPVVAEVPMYQIVDRWFGGRKLVLVAWAKDGNDHKRSSGQLKFTPPPQPLDA